MTSGHRIRTLRVFVEILTIVWSVSIRGREHPFLGGNLSIVRVQDLRAQIDGTPVGSRRDRVAGANVDHVEIEPRLLLFGLHDHHVERRPNALRRMAAGPEVPRCGAHRNIEALRELALGLGHMAILAVLPSQTRLEEIFAPLEERLGLLAGDALAERMTVGAHGSRLNLWITDRRMWGPDIVGPANLSVGRQVAARAREPTHFFRLRSRFWLHDLRRIHIGDRER